MTEVQKAHAKCEKQINEIAEINEEIEQVDNGIQGLQKQINQAKESIEGINSKLLTAAADMTNGSLTSDEYIALKKELREKEGVIEDLAEIIAMQEEIKGRLIGAGSGSQLLDIKNAQKDAALGIKPINTLKARQFKLDRLKEELISALTKQAIDKIAMAAKGEIKELTYLLASDRKYNPAYGNLKRDLYSDLGVALCLQVFESAEHLIVPEVTFKQAHEECAVMVDALNVA